MYSKTVTNDQFYTSTYVSSVCINRMKKYVNGLVMVEPSAGTGSFSDHFPDGLAYDIEPMRDYIKKQDFFDVELPKESYCLYGNPPFGIKNSLSKRFIKRGLEDTNCKVIAFVLPMVYDKITTQKMFSSEWKLVVSDDIPNNSFIANGVVTHIPCKFYVWVRGMNDSVVDLRQKHRDVVVDDFSIVKRGEPSDLFVFGASARKIIPSSEVTKNNRGYFLKSNIDIDVLCDKIRAVDWETVGKSSVSGGVFWLTKNEFLCKYHDFYEENIYDSEQCIKKDVQESN